MRYLAEEYRADGIPLSDSLKLYAPTDTAQEGEGVE